MTEVPQNLKYRRIVLKLSGEVLQGSQSFGIASTVVERLAYEIKEIAGLGLEIGIVLGGGNFFRGAALSAVGLDRVTGDHMGILATVINALAMRDVLERVGINTRVMSAIPISGIVDTYSYREAVDSLKQHRVVLFVAGTGNPFVTTDSAASLRAIEVKADILLKATSVDGIYSADPQKDPNAIHYSYLNYAEVLEKELGVMDLAAFCQCRDYKMPIQVFNIKKPGALLRVVQGKPEGTRVGERAL